MKNMFFCWFSSLLILKSTSPEYWHVNPDNTLCLGVKEQILKIQSSKTPAHFINTLLSRYFYYMSYVKLKGSDILLPTVFNFGCNFFNSSISKLENIKSSLLALLEYQIQNHLSW
jgi:hypothetical protein